MPTKPGRVCNRCRHIAPAGQRCQCTPAWQGSAWTNGGDRRWRTLRNQHLTTHPICQWPGCRDLAVTADHITNLAAGGTKYDPDNLQSLCQPHHNQKTRAEARKGRGEGTHRETE